MFPTLKFSHNYKKLAVLDSSKIARLYFVHETDFTQLHSDFLRYDTDNGLYKLPKKGKCLVLVFASSGGLFTTIRPCTTSSLSYYHSMIGSLFNVKILTNE